MFNPINHRLSYSMLKIIYDYSVAHWIAHKLEDKTTSDPMKMGLLFETLLLEPDTFNDKFIIKKYDSFRSNEAKQWKQDIESKGIEIVTSEQLKTANNMITAINQHAGIDNYLMLGNKSTEIQKELKFNIKLKNSSRSHELIGFLDLVNIENDVIVDLKKIKSCDINTIKKSIQNYSYDLQAFTYSLLYQFHYKRTPLIYFIFIEENAPHGVRIVELSETYMNIGLVKFEAAIAKYEAYLNNPESANNVYYNGKVEPIEVEPDYWYMNKLN